MSSRMDDTAVGLGDSEGEFLLLLEKCDLCGVVRQFIGNCGANNPTPYDDYVMHLSHLL